MHLDHQVLFAVAGEVVLRAEAVPHPGADEHRDDNHADEQADENSAGSAPSTTIPLGAEPFGARPPWTRRSDRHRLSALSALPAVRHR